MNNQLGIMALISNQQIQPFIEKGCQLWFQNHNVNDHNRPKGMPNVDLRFHFARESLKSFGEKCTNSLTFLKGCLEYRQSLLTEKSQYKVKAEKRDLGAVGGGETYIIVLHTFCMQLH